MKSIGRTCGWPRARSAAPGAEPDHQDVLDDAAEHVAAEHERQAAEHPPFGRRLAARSTALTPDGQFLAVVGHGTSSLLVINLAGPPHCLAQRWPACGLNSATCAPPGSAIVTDAPAGPPARPATAVAGRRYRSLGVSVADNPFPAVDLVTCAGTERSYWAFG
ncbi:MAG TPA: hypothetical protein VGL33_05755 [Streptosporangiaceae bacterium]